MSYNTRRGGGMSNSLGNIGQRRPMNNFVTGGQLKSPVHKPQGGPGNQNASPQQNRQQAQQSNTNSNQFRNQQQQQVSQIKQEQQQKQQQPQQQKQQPQQQQQQPQQQQQQQQAAAAAAAAQLQKQQMEQQEAAQAQQLAQQNENTNGAPMDTDIKPKKPLWARGGGGKVSKKERARRRNVRLSKILQPKNAVMILNELVKNTSYMVEELPTKFEGNQFRATVLYEGLEHIGYGRSKIHAKNVAAEAALKHYVKTNKLGELKKDEDGNEKMDVAEDDTNQSPLPWQHVASFALYKLFCSWGEDPSIVKTQTQSIVASEKQHENKPAKKMPPNPENINPLMLINQMLPQAQFEEIGKTGNPPSVTFSFKCTVDGESFTGTGPNKKAAKKMAAFGACSKILGVVYPEGIF